ncbi:MAG: GNAT family N-acetyltransferase [Nocardioidaceae bacterium]
MLRTTTGLRVLGPDDVDAARRVVARDPLTNVFVGHRIDVTGLQPRWLGGEVWGWAEDGRLVSLCHHAANLVPVEATPQALAAFAERAAQGRRTCSSIVGPRADVEILWDLLRPAWGRPRSERWNQPFMTVSGPATMAPDPRVRPVLLDELDVLYPASVAMYTEEVGVSPENGEGASYRARVAQLISRGWAFARIDDGEVVFKAEVGAATAEACQVQGVYVHPNHRGEGLAAAAVAAVIAHAQRTIAPVVTLYVNHHNVPARRAYERAGFRQTGTFATILF